MPNCSIVMPGMWIFCRFVNLHGFSSPGVDLKIRLNSWRKSVGNVGGYGVLTATGLVIIHVVSLVIGIQMALLTTVAVQATTSS